ncbi:MAG: hypothetical protein MI794_16790 [Pseudomonadales bacterium]|nr:hypothetical protein [Pseudomonadales bacterium]
MLRSLIDWIDRIYKSRLGSAALFWDNAGAYLGFSADGSSHLLLATEGGMQFGEETLSDHACNLDGALLKVALPDYWFYYYCLNVSQLPSKQSDVPGFLEWKLGQDLGLVQKGTTVALSGRRKNSDRYTALLLSRDRLIGVEDTLRGVGALLDELMPASFFVHQHILKNLPDLEFSEMPGVIVVLFNGWWTMLLSDHQGDLVGFRSNPWQAGGVCNVQCDVIAQEIRRALIGRASLNPGVALIGEAELTSTMVMNMEKYMLGAGDVINHGNDSFTQYVLDMVLNFER